MPLQLLEIGFHVEIHAIEWHDFERDTQFHGVVVARIEFSLKSKPPIRSLDTQPTLWRRPVTTPPFQRDTLKQVEPPLGRSGMNS